MATMESGSQASDTRLAAVVREAPTDPSATTLPLSIEGVAQRAALFVTQPADPPRTADGDSGGAPSAPMARARYPASRAAFVIRSQPSSSASGLRGCARQLGDLGSREAVVRPSDRRRLLLSGSSCGLGLLMVDLVADGRAKQERGDAPLAWVGVREYLLNGRPCFGPNAGVAGAQTHASTAGSTVVAASSTCRGSSPSGQRYTRSQPASA